MCVCVRTCARAHRGWGRRRKEKTEEAKCDASPMVLHIMLDFENNNVIYTNILKGIKIINSQIN